METEFPEGWVVASLGEVFRFRGGGTPDKKNTQYWNGDIPWASVKDVKGMRLTSTIDSISQKGLDSSAASLARPGDVIVITRISPGETIIPVIETAINQDLKIVSPEGGMKPLFIHYLFKSISKDIIKKSSGTTVLGIRLNELGTIQMPLPPLAEQKRIVTKIEELFSELDAGEASLKQARKQLGIYRQSLLKQAFEGKLTAQWRADNPDLLEDPETLLARIQQERESRHQQQLTDWQQAVEQWEQNGKEGKKPSKPSKLPDIVHFDGEELSQLPQIPEGWSFLRLDTVSSIGSGVSVSRNRQVSNPIDIPYLRVANVQRGVLKLDEIKTMTINKLRLKELRIKHDDVLFNEGGDIDKLGRGWVWKSEIETCITQNHVFRASMYSTSLVVPEFVSHWGNAFGQDFFFKGGKQTTNLASISKTTLSSLPVPIPSPSEQRQILDLLEDQFTVIEQNEREIDAALKRSEALRQSILKRAFSGQLVPQDPNDEPASELLARIHEERSAQQAASKKAKKTAKKKTTRKRAKKS